MCLVPVICSHHLTISQHFSNEGVIHSNICLSLQIRFFGSDLSAITELIDIDLLPEELGGSGAVFSSRYTASLLNSVSSNPEVPEDSTGVV